MSSIDEKWKELTGSSDPGESPLKVADLSVEGRFLALEAQLNNWIYEIQALRERMDGWDRHGPEKDPRSAHPQSPQNQDALKEEQGYIHSLS